MLKSILSFIFIICLTQTIKSQACGVYKLKYVGKIKSKETSKIKIKLPNTFFYHAYSEKINVEEYWSFNFFTIKNEKIDFTIISHLGSLYTSKKLIELYKKSRDFIPILIISINEKGKEERFIKKISYDQLRFSGKDNLSEPTLIIIDLGEINYP